VSTNPLTPLPLIRGPGEAVCTWGQASSLSAPPDKLEACPHVQTRQRTQPVRLALATSPPTRCSLPTVRRDSMHRRKFLTVSLAVGLASSARSSLLRDQPARDVDYRGRSRADLPTPALLVDLPIFETNVRLMADHCRRAGCGFRPHA